MAWLEIIGMGIYSFLATFFANNVHVFKKYARYLLTRVKVVI